MDAYSVAQAVSLCRREPQANSLRYGMQTISV